MRLSVVRVIKAKHVRPGHRLFVAGWEGMEIVAPQWREVTDVRRTGYGDGHIRVMWGEDMDDWESLDNNERVLVIQ